MADRNKAPDTDPVLVPLFEEDTMDKWKIIADSKIARVGASAATLIAVAATVGAGFKWC